MNQGHDPKESHRLSADIGPSLVFIYFMIGMVVGAAITMIGLSFARPYLPDAGWVRWLVIAPLIMGGIIGVRTARSGARERFPLSQALRSALSLWRS
jgi:hypothetical protein